MTTTATTIEWTINEDGTPGRTWDEFPAVAR